MWSWNPLTWLRPRPRPVPAPKPAPEPLPGPDFGAELLAAHDTLRAQCGLPPYAWNDRLAAAAQVHADFMARTGKLAHKDLGDGTPTSRAKDAGFPGFAGWENVAYGPVAVAGAMGMFMSDVPHRANVLNRQTTQFGGAMAVGPRGVFWCCDFGVLTLPAAQALSTTGEPLSRLPNGTYAPFPGPAGQAVSSCRP